MAAMKRNVHLILCIHLILLILQFADARPTLRSRRNKGTAIIMLRHQDPQEGAPMIVAAADRMSSAVYRIFSPLTEHWRKMADTGKMSMEKFDKLNLLTTSGWQLMPNEISERKIEYIPMAGGEQHAVIGFSGYLNTQKNFLDMMKAGAEPQTMQDLSQMIDKAYRDTEVEMRRSAPRRQYLATDGYEIYTLNVGGTSKPKATKLRGNVHVDGFGQAEIQKRLQPIYGMGNADPRTISREDVMGHLKGTYAEILSHFDHMVNPNSPHRPVNSVSASFDAFIMGEDPGQIELFSHEDPEEVRKIQNLAELPLDTIVEDIIKEGGWDESFNNDRTLGPAYDRVMHRLRVDQFEPTMEEGGDPAYHPRRRPSRGGGRGGGGNGGMGGCRTQMGAGGMGIIDCGGSSSSPSGSRKGARSPRNAKPPPTPSKQNPKNMRKRMPFGRKKGIEGGRKPILKPIKRTMNFKKGIGIGKGGRRMGGWGFGRGLGRG